MSDFKNALACVDVLERIGSIGGVAVFTLRTALEAAQQEVDYWKLVHEWRQLADEHSYSNGFNTEHGYFFNCYVNHKKVLELHEGTRFTALRLAADWCRAEIVKK